MNLIRIVLEFEPALPGCARGGRRIDEIPDGNEHSIDAVRYAMIDDVLRG